MLENIIHVLKQNYCNHILIRNFSRQITVKLLIVWYRTINEKPWKDIMERCNVNVSKKRQRKSSGTPSPSSTMATRWQIKMVKRSRWCFLVTHLSCTLVGFLNIVVWDFNVWARVKLIFYSYLMEILRYCNKYASVTKYISYSYKSTVFILSFISRLRFLAYL